MTGRSLILHSVPLLILGACSRSDVDPIVVPRPISQVETLPTILEHDFGSILAQDQTLRHSFILRNPSISPLPSPDPGNGSHTLLLVDRPRPGTRTPGRVY